MPIHDWTRVDANLFHHFHQAWTLRICSALNGGLLPRGYSALVMERNSVARGNRITIRRPLDHIRCVIEVVSPGNKDSLSALRSFVETTSDFLQAGVHLLLIDLFPPSARDPQGIHKVIWDKIEDQPFQLPSDKPLTLAAYVAGMSITAYVEPVAVASMLPDMPAFLDPDSYVPVPLEATYQAAWADCPEDLREAVEGREPSDEAPEGAGP